MKNPSTIAEQFILYIQDKHKLNKTNAIKKAAEQLGCSEVNIWKWLAGEHSPTKATQNLMKLIMNNYII